MNKFVKFRNDLIMDDSIKDNGKYLYAMILTHTNNDGYCYFKLETLSEESGICVKSCSQLISKLEDAGYLKTHIQYHYGQRTNNAYTLNTNMKDDCGYTYLNYDILFHKALDDQDIVQYLKMKRFINNQTNIFKNTKTELLKHMTNCTMKKLNKCLERLQQFGILQVEQSGSIFIITLSYEVARQAVTPEQVIENELKAMKESVEAWRDLNVKDYPV